MNIEEIMAFAKGLGPHDHMMLFYADPESRNTVLSALFAAGFDKGGSALFVSSEPFISGMRETMKRLGLDTESLETKRRIRFERCDPWYIKAGKVDIPSIVRNWKEALSESEAHGGTQFLAAGCTRCFFEAGLVEQLCEYEGSLGRKLSLPIAAICNYDEKDLATVSALTFLRLLKAHEYVGYVASELKVTRIIRFSSAFVEAFEDSMRKLLGDPGAEGFFKYMEDVHSLPKSQVIDRLEKFEEGLREIFGAGADIIHKVAAKRLLSEIGLETVAF